MFPLKRFIESGQLGHSNYSVEYDFSTAIKNEEEFITELDDYVQSLNNENMQILDDNEIPRNNEGVIGVEFEDFQNRELGRKLRVLNKAINNIYKPGLLLPEEPIKIFNYEEINKEGNRLVYITELKGGLNKLIEEKGVIDIKAEINDERYLKIKLGEFYERIIPLDGSFNKKPKVRYNNGVLEVTLTRQH